MKSMKPNEITIGDYVWFKTNKEVAQVIKNNISLGQTLRRLVSLNTLDGKRFCVRIEEIEGLAVTAEMLNDNGWVIFKADGKTPMYAHYDLDGCKEFPRYLQYYFHEGVLRRYYNNELTYLSRPGIRDVHKLQHALRENGVHAELVIKNKVTSNE